MIRRTPLRRSTRIQPSRGTSFPAAVVAHVLTHQHGCIGPVAGMPGDCAGGIQNDHVRASGGVGMKSDSIATNCARLCGLVHHPMKTNAGKTWRPALIAAIGRLASECAACQREHIERYEMPLREVAS